MTDKISKVLIARRQKDLEGFTEYYAAQLEQVIGDRIHDLHPAWERMKKRAEKRLEALYADAKKVYDNSKLVSIEYKAGRERQFISQLTADLRLLDAQQQPYFTQAIAGQLQHGYYYTAFGLEQSAHVAATVPLLTQATVLGVTANPWLADKLTYSDRIRLNTALVADKARSVVAIATEQGLSINTASRMLTEKIDEGYYNATRIMRTELNRAASQGASMSYMQNADILDGKRWNATLDAKTAPKDAANDGNIYDLDYDTPANPGVPGQRIPNHPNCRCSYVPVLSALGVSTKERIARGEGSSKNEFGQRTYTDARTYDEYAKERGLPSTDELLKKDDPRRYLRNGETLESLQKEVVRVKFDNGNSISIPRAPWDEVKATVPNPTSITSSTPGFTPAKNVKEATAWGRENLGIDFVDYKGFDVQTANAVNETLYDLRQRFPQVTGTKIVSTSQNMCAMKYADDVERYVQKAIQMGHSEETARQWAKTVVKRRKVPGNTYAWSTNHTWGKYEGITFNKKWVSNHENFVKAIASDIKLGWHPIGTENPASVLTHEFGHQLDYVLMDNGIRDWVYDMFMDMRKQATSLTKGGITPREAYGSLLSQYANQNDKEFFAEAFSEWIHSPNPRPIAKAVGEKLTEVLKDL